MNHMIGQLMMIGISGKSLTTDEKKFIKENNISGVTLFSRNVESPQQIRQLCLELQSLRHQMPDKAPLFIAIDMEGGRVARLKEPFTIWPPMKKLGDLDNPTVSFHFTNKMGMELKAVGINLDFSPCLDVFTNPKNTVIGDRAVSTDPEIVAKHASALIRGFIKADVIACAKHFPGHGNTLIDSHEDLPVENADKKRLDEVELVPFKRAFRSRVDLIMTAHMKFPNIDPDWPVTLSEIFLKNILRDECRYRGLVITDDLDMKAMAKHYDPELIPVRSLQAGADILLYCNEPTSPPKAIESVTNGIAQGQLDKKLIEALHTKVLNYKKDKIKNPDPLPWDQVMQIVGSADHLKLSSCIAQGIVPEGLLVE